MWGKIFTYKWYKIIKMLVKIHKSYRIVVAICDTELKNKQFEQENKQLDLASRFYDGEEKSKQEVIEIMKDYNQEDATFNIVGKQSIEAALEAGIISKEGIKTIKDVPYALVLM